MAPTWEMLKSWSRNSSISVCQVTMIAACTVHIMQRSMKPRLRSSCRLPDTKEALVDAALRLGALAGGPG